MFQAPKQNADISKDKLRESVSSRVPLKERFKGVLWAEEN